MLVDIFKDLLCIVGIVFLGFIFVIIVMNTINEIKISKSKEKVLKAMENITLEAFQKELNKSFKEINNQKDKR